MQTCACNEGTANANIGIQIPFESNQLQVRKKDVKCWTQRPEQ